MVDNFLGLDRANPLIRYILFIRLCWFGAEIRPLALTEHLQIQVNLEHWSRREELNLQPTHYESITKKSET